MDAGVTANGEYNTYVTPPLRQTAPYPMLFIKLILLFRILNETIPLRIIENLTAYFLSILDTHIVSPLHFYHIL